MGGLALGGTILHTHTASFTQGGNEFGSAGNPNRVQGHFSLAEQAADPAAVALRGLLYTKDAAGITQLFYRASDGTVHQLSPAAGIGGSGVAGQVAFFTAPTTLGGDTGLTYTSGTDTLQIGPTGGTGTIESVDAPLALRSRRVASGVGDSVSLRGGNAVGVNAGGSVTVQGGLSGTSPAVAGGQAILAGGSGAFPNGSGGPVLIAGGTAAASSGGGGSVQIIGSSAATSGAPGGSVTITAGSGGVGSGGNITLTAGNRPSSTTGPGGGITLTSGDGHASVASVGGGKVRLFGGDAFEQQTVGSGSIELFAGSTTRVGGNGNGGDVLMEPGTSTGSGAAGKIIGRTRTDSVDGVSFRNAAGTAVLSVDTANGRGGVNTAAPSQAWEVQGKSRLDNGANAPISVPVLAVDPAAPANGDVWIFDDGVTRAFRMRAGGVTYSAVAV